MRYQLVVFSSAVLTAVLCSASGALRRDGEPYQQPQVSITPRQGEVAHNRQQATLRLDVNVVIVPVSVTDPLNRPVTALSKDRFRLLEDGVPQNITSFSQDDGPVSLGLLFDSSGSMSPRIAASVESLRLLFQTTIPGDEF